MQSILTSVLIVVLWLWFVFSSKSHAASTAVDICTLSRRFFSCDDMFKKCSFISIIFFFIFIDTLNC